jgi:hypothetical protein
VLGLAEVAPKGKRSGKPDCAQWPLNVRPLGYYGESDPRAVKAESPDAGEASDDGGAAPGRKPSRAARHEAAMREAMNLIKEDKAADAWAVLDAALR